MCVVGQIDAVQRPLRPRLWAAMRAYPGATLGLMCAVCSDFMLYVPTMTVAGHGEALRSARGALQ